MNCSRASIDGRRILVVIRYPVGGIRTYVLYNYPALLDAGYRFTFVGPADADFRRFRDELASWEASEFVEAPVAGRKCRLRSTVRRLLKQGRFSLVHSQGMTAAVDAVIANRGLGVPHVATSHDVVRSEQFPGIVGQMKLIALGWLLSRAQALIAVSHDARDNHLHFLPNLKRGPCKLVTITNGIEVERLAEPTGETRSSLRNRLGIGDDVFLMGFLGRFMEQKGFVYLLDAIEHLVAESDCAPFHLIAVGSGDYERESKAQVSRRPSLAEVITFLDFVPDVSPILRELDLLVMPSLWEACPLLPMEALAAGVPVLGTDCIGLREVLRGTPSVTVPARDSSALAESIRGALAKPWTTKASEYAAEARRRFDVRASAQRLVALFGEIRVV